MTYEQFLEIFPALFKAGKAIQIQGAPGGGKSSIIKALIARLSRLMGEEVGFTMVFPANQTPNMVMGFPIPRDTPTGIITDYAAPLWWQCYDAVTGRLTGKKVTDFRFGVCVIEEWGQGEPEVKRAMADLLCNKQLGPWKLPDGWLVVAISNRSTDRSGVTKEFDHIINRRCEIEVTPDVHTAIAYINAKGTWHPVFTSFLEAYPDTVLRSEKPEIQAPWCTMRSLEACNDRFVQLVDANGDLPTGSVATELAIGDIGKAAAAQLIQHIQLGQSMPSYKDILTNPETVPVPTNPGACMLICYKLAHNVREADMDAVVKYMKRMPKEFALTFIKAATARDNDLIMTEALGKWGIENATLLAAIQSVRNYHGK